MMPEFPPAAGMIPWSQWFHPRDDLTAPGGPFPKPPCSLPELQILDAIHPAASELLTSNPREPDVMKEFSMRVRADNFSAMNINHPGRERDRGAPGTGV